MAMTIKDWWNLPETKKINQIATDNFGKMATEIFLRDPIRGRHINWDYFVSPADGMIVYQDIVKPSQQIVEIKGMHYTLKDIMEDNTFDRTCLVIGIFMSYYDVHINRCAYPGVLKHQMLSATTSYNRPMVFTETDLFKGNLAELYKNMNYIKTNSRMKNTIYSPNLDYTYYIMQIGDTDVNSIMHFNMAQNIWYDQGQRFSLIRCGSQVELILPIDKRYEFKTLVPDHWHVEAVNDRLVEIIKTKKKNEDTETDFSQEVNPGAPTAVFLNDFRKKKKITNPKQVPQAKQPPWEVGGVPTPVYT